ncbi:PQ-loop domain-containing transporter [Bradyrhizobium sp. U531]|uniref:SemiSWEET family sugar transporter n=1 Tax=Bradyrhizobium sp. U531 TaxID=3053458 RepID=UPI003F43C6C2
MIEFAPYLGGLAATLASLSYIPQVKKAWPRGSTGDLSLGMLTALTAGLVLWIIYGLIRSDWIIVRQRCRRDPGRHRSRMQNAGSEIAGALATLTAPPSQSLDGLAACRRTVGLCRSTNGGHRNVSQGLKWPAFTLAETSGPFEYGVLGVARQASRSSDLFIAHLRKFGQALRLTECRARKRRGSPRPFAARPAGRHVHRSVE